MGESNRIAHRCWSYSYSFSTFYREQQLTGFAYGSHWTLPHDAPQRSPLAPAWGWRSGWRRCSFCWCWSRCCCCWWSWVSSVERCSAVNHGEWVSDTQSCYCRARMKSNYCCRMCAPSSATSAYWSPCLVYGAHFRVWHRWYSVVGSTLSCCSRVGDDSPWTCYCCCYSRTWACPQYGRTTRTTGRLAATAATVRTRIPWWYWAGTPMRQALSHCGASWRWPRWRARLRSSCWSRSSSSWTSSSSTPTPRPRPPARTLPGPSPGPSTRRRTSVGGTWCPPPRTACCTASRKSTESGGRRTALKRIIIPPTHLFF